MEEPRTNTFPPSVKGKIRSVWLMSTSSMKRQVGDVDEKEREKRWDRGENAVMFVGNVMGSI